MRILVTGGAGFIGSNLVHALVGRHEVTVIDDLSTGSIGNLHPAAAFHRADIVGDELAALVGDARPEAVVHLAAQSSVTESLKDPERDRAVNVEGTRRVAEAAREAGARVMLSASSAAVYGEPAELPLTETSPKAPANPYGVSKLDAEAALAEALSGSGTDFAGLRFSNVYGPRQDALGEGGVVAIFAAAMTEGRAPTIFGSGRQTRDYIYVGDVVSAIMAAIDSAGSLSLPGEDGPAYNVSTGRETSLEDLARVMRSASRYLGGVGRGDAREGDVERSSLDPAKAARVFGWSAGVPLEQGIAHTVRWFAAQR